MYNEAINSKVKNLKSKDKKWLITFVHLSASTCTVWFQFSAVVQKSALYLVQI